MDFDVDLEFHFTLRSTAILWSIGGGILHTVIVLTLNYWVWESLPSTQNGSLFWISSGLLIVGTSTTYLFIVNQRVGPILTLSTILVGATSLSWLSRPPWWRPESAMAVADWGLGLYMALWPIILLVTLAVGAIERYVVNRTITTPI